jgi:tetratricopeptide (TPR) repeat protein
MADKMRRKSEVITKNIPRAAPGDWKLIAGIAVLLTVATIAVYWQAGSNGFVNYDDNVYITSNRQVKMGLSWETVRWAFTSYDASNWHPLTWLSHMLDIQLFGMKAGGHHLVNVGFHVVNTLLLFWLLCYTTRRTWPSALVAGLFALHPLHVESVAWVSERKDVLSTFFWLWTMLAYVYYTKRHGTLRYVTILLLFALGLMTKPMLVTLPLVLVLVDYWPLERFEIRRQKGKIGLVGTSLWRLFVEKVPLLIMAGGSAAITVMVQRTAMPAWEIMDLPMRVTNAVVSYWRYMWEMVWPVGLAAFYPHPHKPLYLEAALVLLLLVAATAGALYVSKDRKYVTFGWLWYLVTLVPVIGLVQVGDQSHADRYTYVPLIGLFVIIAWAAAETVERYDSLLKPLAAAAILVLTVFGVLVWRQVGFWKDDIMLFGRAVNVTQGNYVMLANLGVTYSARDELDKAMDALQKSLAIRPDESRTLNGLGSVMFKRQQYAQAVVYYAKAIGQQPDLKEAQLAMARTLLAMRRSAEGEPYARKAIALDPYWADAYAQLGAILGETGKLEEGMALCRKAMELDPRLAASHFNLAGIYVHKENFELAAEEYRKAIALEGDFSAWNNLGNSLLRLGKPQEAEKSYRESIRLNPGRADAFYNMGIALEEQGRRAEAIEAVRKALTLLPDSVDIKRYLDALITGRQPQETKQ